MNVGIGFTSQVIGRLLCFTSGTPGASSSGRSSLQTVSQTDAGSHLSTAVFPSVVNSAASSRHRANGGSGRTSRLGQLSHAATSESESEEVETGQLPGGAGQLQTASNAGKRAGRAAVGPDDLAAVSHADGGKRGLLVVPGQMALKPYALDMDMDVTACSSQDGNAPEQQRAAQTSPLQLPSMDSAAHAAADGGVSAESLNHSQERICYGAEPQHLQHCFPGSAVMAQLPRFADADSSKSASGIILSPLSSAGRHSGPVSSGDSDAAAGASGHRAAALRQPMTQPEGSSLQVPLAAGSAPQGMPQDVRQPHSEMPFEQTAGTGAGPAEIQRQTQAALGTVLSMSQAEQRNVEEQEVLYNMTGQTGSLMYMAPEVSPIP